MWISPQGRSLLCSLLCVLVFLTITPAVAGAYPHTQSVLIIHSYHQGFAWTDEVTTGINEVLTPNGTLDVPVEFMDTKRYHDEAYFRDLFSFYQAKYAGKPPDLILADEEDAYNFLLQHHDVLFPGVPVVFIGVNYVPGTAQPPRPDFTGVLEDYQINRTIDLALRLHPGIKNLVIINDNVTSAGVANQQILEPVLPSYAGRMNISFISNVTLQELGDQVAAIDKDSIVLLLTFNQDREGNTVSYDESAAKIAANCNVPVYGVWDFYLGKGIVGGMMTTGEIQGKIAGQMAEEILAGQNVTDIPVTIARPDAGIFDYQQLQRFNIDPADLPIGSVIINQPSTMMEFPKLTVMGTVLLCIGLFVIVLALFIINRRTRTARERLRISEERFRSIFDLPLIGIAIIASGGQMLMANKKLCSITGFSHAEVMKRTWRDLSLQEDLPGEEARVAAMYRGEQETFSVEKRLTRQDGQVIAIEEAVAVVKQTDGLVDYFVVVISDITRRKQVEEELHQHQQHLEEQVMRRTVDLETAIARLTTEVQERSRTETLLAAEKERLAITLRSIADGVITTDAAGQVRMMNPVAEELTGWRQEEAVGLPLARVFVTGDKVPWDGTEPSLSMAAQSSGTPSRLWGSQLISADGTRHTIAASSAEVPGHEEDQGGSIIVFQDITSLRQMEEELLKNQKIESLGVLAGGIAHDFNNILTIIIGHLELAEMDLDDDDPVTLQLNKAAQALFRARGLTTQLLTFAQGGAPVRTISYLSGMIEETVTFTLRGSKSRALFRLSTSLPAVDVDLDQISQVVSNLVMNADQAMPAGGTMIITGEVVTLAKGTLSLPSGEYVAISVKDTGIGIPSELMGKIFDPYYSTHSVGRGLGLSSSLSIIRNHGGGIEVHSVIGEGSTFTFYLPVTCSRSPGTDTA
jgi:PAS domain S-box-containing protein